MTALFDHFNIDQEKRDKFEYWYDGYCENVDKGVVVKKYNIWSSTGYINS